MGRWWFWACPDCIGIHEESLSWKDVRCVRCGRTLAQWERRQPLNVAILPDALATDLLFERRAFVDFDEAFPDAANDDPS